MSAGLYRRVDPNGCGCTDCITGYSIPLDLIPSDERKMYMASMHCGVVVNATGGRVVREVSYKVEY